MSDEGSRPSSTEQISELLAAWAGQDSGARDRLVPLVYDELRRLAHYYMRGERAGHTLQTTALVNEMYLRLAGLDRMQWRDRAHFMAMVATLMRRVLVEHARANARDKRGGNAVITTLDGKQVAAPGGSVDVLALDRALDQLAALDPLQSQIVQMRFFGGLTVDETAEVLCTSASTVKREWTMARAWLHHQLSGASGP
jgi:RNA polymerase sigma factor (TIGR02999 family)